MHCSVLVQQVFMPSGRMLGGSDSFSNMIYARGNPQDYDTWAAMGATGWSYEDVLPYFIKSENNRNAFFKTSRKSTLYTCLSFCLVRESVRLTSHFAP